MQLYEVIWKEQFVFKLEVKHAVSTDEAEAVLFTEPFVRRMARGNIKEYTMLTAIQGIYRDGKIQLTEAPRHVHDDTPVIVTFLTSDNIDLAVRGIDEPHAADLRTRLTTFAEEWNSPEMDIYDNYDAAKTNV